MVRQSGLTGGRRYGAAVTAVLSPLRQLSRMRASSRYPIEATPPAELFDRSDAQQAIAMAQAVLKAVADLDRPTG